MGYIRPMFIDKLPELTLEEKVGLLTGASMWRNFGVERLGIPPVKMTDGPNGARGESKVRTPAVLVPAGIALGASWDPNLLGRVGDLLGKETLRKKCHVLLGPTINIQRTAVGGRTFECYSEDPELTARLGVAFIAGVQANKVAATPKHFLCNDQEFERHRIDCVVDETTLREIYLRPFEAAVIESDAKALMSAYNKVNGVHATENKSLLREVLREEWGFSGYVMSDWFAVRSGIPTVEGGTTMEMPGPSAHFGEHLVAAVTAGHVDMSVIDGLAAEVLSLLDWVDTSFGVDEPEETVDAPDERALCREASISGTVMLKNDNVLPLNTHIIDKVAVIGPLAGRAQIMGGGSSAVVPIYRRTPYEAIAPRLFNEFEIETDYAEGSYIDKMAPIFGAGQVFRTNGEPGFDVETYAGREFSGEQVQTDSQINSEIRWRGGAPDAVDPKDWSARATGRYVVSATGLHRFSVSGTDQARLLIDGTEIISIDRLTPRGDAYYTLGSQEVFAEVELEQGQSVDLVVEISFGSNIIYAARIGCVIPRSADLLADAVRLAKKSDCSILVIGTTDEWETEGTDRADIEIPAGQNELVAAVAAVSKQTIVVLNIGGPVAMPWLDEVDAVIVPWFGGQEMAEAVTDILVGVADPGGRLPMTFPFAVEDNPSDAFYPGEDLVMPYGEGQMVGYRGYDAAGTDVLFPFGFGLSYGEHAIGSITGPSEASVGEMIVLGVPVSNTGDRDGSTVVQVYLEHRDTQGRPLRELVAFQKIAVDAGESSAAQISVHPWRLSRWDDVAKDWATAVGTYRFHVGESSRNLTQSIDITIT
jgi:beta-glucosidase